MFAPDGSVSWKLCTVTDYDLRTNSYAVVFEGAVVAYNDETGERAPPAAHWVPRVRVCFAAEDPFVFARRFGDAGAARDRAESMLRYSLYIDSMPIDDLPPVSTEQVCPTEPRCLLGDNDRQ